MAASFLKSRQTKYTAYAAAYILVILAVLAAVNFLANRYDKSYDSTSNKQFSLSDQTIKVVEQPEERRQAHLLRRSHATSPRRATCWTATPPSRPNSTSSSSTR